MHKPPMCLLLQDEAKGRIARALRQEGLRDMVSDFGPRDDDDDDDDADDEKDDDDDGGTVAGALGAATRATALRAPPGYDGRGAQQRGPCAVRRALRSFRHHYQPHHHRHHHRHPITTTSTISSIIIIIIIIITIIIITIIPN
jgi:hypothetical protein